MREFQILQQIANTPSKNEKQRILASCPTEAMKKILYLTMNKFITFRVNQIDYPDYYNVVQPDVINELEELLLGLAKHKTGSNDAKFMLKRFLAKSTAENAQWIVRVVQRDLNIGMSEKSVNKVFPDLIPTFAVQLANKIEDLSTVTYPVIVEEKLDGMRTIAVVQDGSVNFYSREGRELSGLDPIAEEILRLLPGSSFVLDGELIGKKFNPKNKTAVKNKDGNWPFAQALSMVKNQDTSPEDVREFLGFYVWDVIGTEYFLSQGTKGQAKPLTQRKLELEALFSRTSQTFNNIFQVPNVVAMNQAEVKALFEQIRAQNGEGVMLKKMDAPYSFRRNDNVQKLKEFYTYDLRIIGAFEGNKDTKYEGMLGGLVVADDTGKIKSDVGSGFTDEDRVDLWLRYLGGTLVGSIVEIMFQEVTIDGSLRFPTFIGERYDKTITSLI